MLDIVNWSNQNKGILKHCKMIIRRRRRLKRFKKFPSYQKGHGRIHLAKTYVVSSTILNFKLLICLGTLRKNPVVYFYRFALCNGVFQLEIYVFITVTRSIPLLIDYQSPRSSWNWEVQAGSPDKTFDKKCLYV